MKKFKQGDRVVVAYNKRKRSDFSERYGQSAIVAEYWDHLVLFKDKSGWCYIEEDLELEQVFNSPLWKALE